MRGDGCVLCSVVWDWIGLDLGGIGEVWVEARSEEVSE